MPVGLADIRALNIYGVLEPNESEKNYGSSNTTLNIYMKNFQCRQTTLWRGTAPKTSLMIPPVIIEDETNNKNTAKVILLMLAMFGILEVMSQ